jgi:hypothetical protein
MVPVVRGVGGIEQLLGYRSGTAHGLRHFGGKGFEECTGRSEMLKKAIEALC